MSSNRSTKPRDLIRSGADRNKVMLKTNVILLLALVMIIFILPAIPKHGPLLTGILLSTLVISGLFAADFSKSSFRLLSIIGLLVILLTVIDLVLPESRGLRFITFLSNTLFFIAITIALVTHVASARRVYSSTLLCAINSYLLIGLTLSILFLIMDLLIPDSFSQLDSAKDSLSSYAYFGFVTLTTLGYGDITPDTALARSLSTFTALFGQIYLVTIMALLIGKFLNSKNTSE